MIANIGQATELLYRHGNVGRTADDLLRNAPTDGQLKAAIQQCHAEVDAAEQLIRQHFKMPS